VKKIFSIAFGTRKEQRDSLKDEFVGRVRRHPFDAESLEYRIAERTFFIRSLKEAYYQGHTRRNGRLKTFLLEAVDRRNKLLKQLGRQDAERYIFVKQQLDIDHTPFPLGKCFEKVTRKGELRRLTDEYATKLKGEKMEAYHDKLKVLQQQFVVEKKETESWIAKEIADLQLTEDEVKSLEFKGSLQ